MKSTQHRTGVVVTVFVEAIPDVKRRQIKQAVEAYEAMRRKQPAGKRETAVMKKPLAKQVEHEHGQKPERNRARKNG